MLVSTALMGYTIEEQTKILKSLEEGTDLPTKRLTEGREKVIEALVDWEPVVEGYAGFPVDRDHIQKKKDQHSDDRNIGRVVSQGGTSMVITGKKADGRYIVVGKKGEKTAKDGGDLGVTTKSEQVGIDIEDLHNQMLESLKQARKNVGASKCWDGYKAKGTKTKNGKQVPNCVKEEEIEEGKKGLWDNIHAKRKRGEKPAKPGDKDYPKTLNVEDVEVVDEAPKYDKEGNDKYDRSKRMIRHKQKKYGVSTFKQRLMTGADHNIDNEKKAKMKKEAADFWHPDPEKDRKLGGPGANQRAREDRAAASKPKSDPKKLKKGESYMDYAKRQKKSSVKYSPEIQKRLDAAKKKKEGLGSKIKRKLGLGESVMSFKQFIGE